MSRQPRIDSEGHKELNKVQEQISTLTEPIANSDISARAALPEVECEPQTKLSSREAKSADAPYIKPLRSISSKEKFNDKYKDAHRNGWEYVKCIVENKEIIGEAVEVWTKKFPGDPAHFWRVPVNKPIFIPRLLAEQLASCKYSRLKMKEDERQVTGSDHAGTYVGALQFEETVKRIDCTPVGFGFGKSAF